MRGRLPLALAAVTLALLGARALSMTVVAQPGYTDAYYYAVVAERLARGEGLTADFVWNFLEAPQFAALPVASHRFWMPLASVVPAIGIFLAGAPLGDFRAGQLALVVFAAFIPVVTYAAARYLGTGAAWSLAAAAVAGLGGAFAPGWVSIDSFAIAAVLGAGFFLAFGRAARGSVRAGLAAGLLVGLLHLARAEGALFGLVLLPLLGSARTRRAGAVATGAALAIGLGWLARGALLVYPEDVAARAMLLVRYEDFFALDPPTLAAFFDRAPLVVSDKIGGLATNLVTALMALLVVLAVPLVVAVRRLRADPAVRAFVFLALTVYLAQSLLFTLHSTRGSFFHSVASLFPFAVALAAAGAQHLFGSPARGLARTVALAAVAGYAAVSVSAVVEWDASFNTVYRERAAVAAALPPGPIVTTDASAWRWISGRQAVVAPAGDEQDAFCAAEIYLAETLILERSHFSAYAELYDSGRSEYFTLRAEHDGIRLYAPATDQRCVIAGPAAKPPLLYAGGRPPAGTPLRP
ncbi:MAG: hypothetical protein ACRDGT_01795 [Candidatus Limnocylindria bacterium]